MSAAQRSPESPDTGRGFVWRRRYCDLVNFVAASGTMPREIANPTGVMESEERRLGGWVRYQRRRDSQGVLPGWQRELLDQIPAFSWDPLEAQWNEWFLELRIFLAAERRMPRYRADNAGEKALAAWVHKQRFFHRQGALAQNRIASLRSLPFRVV